MASELGMGLNQQGLLWYFFCPGFGGSACLRLSTVTRINALRRRELVFSLETLQPLRWTGRCNCRSFLQGWWWWWGRGGGVKKRGPPVSPTPVLQNVTATIANPVSLHGSGVPGIVREFLFGSGKLVLSQINENWRSFISNVCRGVVFCRKRRFPATLEKYFGFTLQHDVGKRCVLLSTFYQN